MAINPDGGSLRRFLEEDDGQPFVMLNLLRFAAGGRERYAEYARKTAPFLRDVGGEVVYFGRSLPALVSESGQAWDAVILVRYPSRAAFTAMVRNQGYQAITHLRTEALLEAVLQPTTDW
jgi:uncharacterized protein (DUF1330 family)